MGLASTSAGPANWLQAPSPAVCVAVPLNRAQVAGASAVSAGHVCVVRARVEADAGRIRGVRFVS